VTADGKVEVTVKAKNTGKRAGDEVVQMYVEHLGSAVERAQLELKGFERVHIEPGAEKSVVLDLKPRDLAYWDSAQHAWRVEKGPIRILAGGSSDELPVQAILQIETSGEFKP
jgi:beta-glucosidase